MWLLLKNRQKILKSFYQFPAFIDTLRLEVSQYPGLIAQFSSGNQTRIKQGLTAKASLEGWHYGSKEIVKKLQIHHHVATECGGSVYDIDNLRIITPRLHDEIHYRK